MSTISFSVEDDIKQQFNRWAKHAKKSKSDVFRDMVRSYEFAERMEATQRLAESQLKALGLDTEADIYDYLESDETYEDRLRHQRLHRGNQTK